MKKLLFSLGLGLMALLLIAGLLWCLNRPAEASAPEARAGLWLESELVEDCPVWDGESFFSLNELARQRVVAFGTSSFHG